MKEKIKFGIIGFGGFGRFIYRAILESKHVKVIAIADETTSSEEIPEDVEFYSDWNDLLKNTSVTAILVATPPSTHFEITKNAIRANKHVITEKPLTIKPDEAERIKVLAQEYDRVVMVDFLQRFNPLLNNLHQLYTKNLFGQLERYYVENYAQDESLPINHWFWNDKISGGIITEHAVHFIDIVHWFDHQPILTIHGNFDYRNETQMDRVFANIHYKNGLIASHYHSFSRPNVFERTKMRFVFSNAQFDLNGWIPESGQFTLLGTSNTEKELSLLPNLVITKKEAVNSSIVRGRNCEITHLFEGKFKSSLTKEALYINAIRSIFRDFSKKIHNNSHTLKVSLDDAAKAVYVAHEVKKQASVSNLSSN